MRRLIIFKNLLNVAAHFLNKRCSVWGSCELQCRQSGQKILETTPNRKRSSEP